MYYFPFTLIIGGCAQLDLIDDTATLTDTPDIAHVPDITTKPRFHHPRHKDLWNRIRQKLTLLHIDHPRIDKQIKALSRDNRYIDLLARRAEPFLHYLAQETDSRDLPIELVFVPMVESNFRPTAVSTGPGKAAGLWQITPATGKHLGLEQTKWYDARHDVHASTDAALEYLIYLNEIFDGDWLLTLAAYNSGVGRVLAAIKKNRHRGKATDYWSLDLPPITKEYIPKVLALSKIVADPDGYGVELDKIEDKPYLQRVTIGPGLDLSVVASAAGISEKKVRFLNAGYKRGVPRLTLRNYYQLVLPQENASVLNANMKTQKVTKTS